MCLENVGRFQGKHVRWSSVLAQINSASSIFQGMFQNFSKFQDAYFLRTPLDGCFWFTKGEQILESATPAPALKRSYAVNFGKSIRGSMQLFVRIGGYSMKIFRTSLF